MTGDKRNVFDVREALEAARHRQPQRHRRLRIRAADGWQQRRREPHARVVGVNPVPGEVAEADRRDAGGRANRKRERRDVADDQAGAQLAQHPRLTGGARHQIAVKRRGAADRVRLIERQRVDLHDAGVAFQRAVSDLALDAQVEQPPRRRGADADAGFRALGKDGVDDLDGARGVSEAVTGNIKDDRWCQSALVVVEGDLDDLLEGLPGHERHVGADFLGQFCQVRFVHRRQDHRPDASRFAASDLFADAANGKHQATEA